jgi:hypothetical protein
MDLAGMLEHEIRNRVLKILEAEKQDWDRVKTLPDWKEFRDPRLKALAAALGKFPDRGPLETRVTSEFRGDGYRRDNLVYQSRPGLWVTANLYLPAEQRKQMPGIVITQPPCAQDAVRASRYGYHLGASRVRGPSDGSARLWGTHRDVPLGP